MITPQQAQIMRLRIIAALDTDDETSDRDSDNNVIVDIDQRFIDQIFTDTLHMSTWAESWNIATELFSLSLSRRTSTRSHWVRFKKA